MPRGFTETEKKLIRSALLEKGKEIFETYGFRKTTISDLTEAVGISKGSFYHFYESKEVLFLDILDGIEDRIQTGMIKEMKTSRESAPDLLKRLLKKELAAVEEEPILKMALEGDLIERIWRKIPEARKKANLDKDLLLLDRFMEARPDAHFLKSRDLRLVVGLFRSLFFLLLHKEEIGAEVLEAVTDFQVEALVDKLIKEAGA